MSTNEEVAAVKTLQKLGYTYNYGELWKPPIGKQPAYLDGNHVLVSASALYDVLSALLGPPHLIRELMVIANSPIGGKNSIKTLVDEYNAAVSTDSKGDSDGNTN